ncbi:YdcF family protein [Bacillus shivajii]|uniref:YdcF family protein n=1 Tax=Bacillus shivajii TaxID=1983719 RepID=UPI001CFAA043|nr:YdcF family protein [Bacillus shivajii]UCZ53507.1 YdcF family protein [Bacillus shivajii]
MLIGWKTKFKRFFLIFFIFFVAWFVIHTVVIVVDGFTDDLNQADAAVVLGNKVELDGEPSKRLQARLDKAAELYDEGYFDYVIVSGGVGEEGFEEAKVMKNDLVGQGIPTDRIIEDDNGYNTAMTAENSRVIMDQFGLDSVMVITQHFHISRTKLAFKQEGFEEVYSAHAEIFELRDLYSTVREFPAYYKYFLTQ